MTDSDITAMTEFTADTSNNIPDISGILDIHRHLDKEELTGLSGRNAVFDPGKELEIIGDYPGLIFSVGIHPWLTADNAAIPEEIYSRLAETARYPQVVAIGECGIDLLKGGAMFRQLQLFKRHVELSEETGKPMIIHDVKADDIILGLHRDLRPIRKWAIHGFRGKPGAAKMLLGAGFYLSFGDKFNVETLRLTPATRILAETDESEKPIEKIIKQLSEARGEDLRDQIAENTLEFLRKNRD